MGIIDEAITPINSNGMVYAAYVVCSTDATASIESQIGSLMFHFILAWLFVMDICFLFFITEFFKMLL